jgi:8-oxo-dGTP pyrophosphatase MutT (NUDIX family)
MIHSAGAVVVGRDERGGSHLALVKTSGHLWAIPKGHLKPGEKIEQAAYREVEEETGLPRAELELIRYLGAFEYNEYASSVPKLNHFFLMEHVSTGLPPLAPDADHSRAAWWEVPLRGLPLAYDYQRSLLLELGLWQSPVDG